MGLCEPQHDAADLRLWLCCLRGRPLLLSPGTRKASSHPLCVHLQGHNRHCAGSLCLLSAAPTPPGCHYCRFFIEKRSSDTERSPVFLSLGPWSFSLELSSWRLADLLHYIWSLQILLVPGFSPAQSGLLSLHARLPSKPGFTDGQSGAGRH